ncbi:MAG: tRNA-2-methylthio-N6-dimethylallyladenosine synthase [Patescibacteria group bacterium]|nr:tRNA-2-methylthio-N6-dimethylallyladenosine synthase [Patescibacteria group bacterium]
MNQTTQLKTDAGLDFASKVESKPKYYFIQTFGCQANVRDSQVMAGTLDALGFIQTQDHRTADVLIINTCSVRQKSEDKVYGWGIKLGVGLSSRNWYKKRDEQVVFVTGCMVGSAKGDRTRVSLEKLKEKLSWADYLLAPNEEIQIPSILVKEGLIDEWATKAIGKEVVNNTAGSSSLTADPHMHNETNWAYINISTGCDNFCTFCVVPYARGEEKSRTKEEILHEVKHLASRGFKNIMLVGQNVNSWGLDRETKFKLRAGSEHKIPFADLLRSIHEVDEVEKINFISSNPFDFTKDLIETLDLPKITRYLHFAVQSGNNDVLQRMNRRHTIEDFKSLVWEIKKRVPDMEFGTDIIVGFPGETEEQFMDTVKLFEELPFKNAYISIYSSREGTSAQKFMKDDVSIKEKKRRHAYLMDVWTSRNPISS